MSNVSVTPLNLLNYLNLSGYIANTVVTYGIGIYGFFGFPNNAQVSQKYQTVITPAGWSFGIWGLIFLSQAVFAIAQVLPSYRNSVFVQKGVGYFYFAACMCQALWTFAFCSEQVVLSFIGMLAILVSLALVVSSQYKNQTDEKTSAKVYFIMRFPFEVHLGWIIAASALNLSFLLVAYATPATPQVVIGALSLAFLLVVGAVSVFLPSPPLYTIALVLSWAALGIWTELGSPKAVIEEKFSSNQIRLIRSFAGFVFIMGLHLVVLKPVVTYFRKRSAQAAEEEGHVDDGEEETAYLNADRSGTAITNTN